MEKAKRHLRQIESLRAIAALAVAIFHFSAYYFYLWDDKTTEILTFGAQGVEIFYLISGFIIPYSLFHGRYRIEVFFRYMGKRLVRLLPPYLATIILIHIFSWVMMTFYWHGPFDIHFKQVIVNVFFLADLFPQYDWINPIFATLEVEVQFYILIGIFFPFVVKRDWHFLFFCLMLLLLGVLTNAYDTVLINSPYFICGMSIFFIQTKGFKSVYFLTIFAAMGIIHNFFQIEDMVAFIFGGAMIILLPSTFRFLNLTGRISYSYYLIHGLLGGHFIFFMKSTSYGQNHPILVIILALIISWIGAFLLYSLFEKPALKISKRIRYRK